MTLTLTLLSNEQALSQRILLGRSVPAEFWSWLADRNSSSANVPPAGSQQELASKLSELIEPMLAGSNPPERSRYARTAEMIAAMFRFIASRAESQRWTFANRMLAASLMPLYRCLATGELHEALQQTRVALGESLALVGAAGELGADLDQLMERESNSGVAPHECCQTTLNLQLSRLARVLVFAGAEWDHADEAQLVERVECADSESRIPRAAAWAKPSATWRLAGELMSKRAEFVMPREWINVPVPWGSVSEHWSSLEHLLATVASRGSVARQSDRDRDCGCKTSDRPLTTSQAGSVESFAVHFEGSRAGGQSLDTGRSAVLAEEKLVSHAPAPTSNSFPIEGHDEESLEEPRTANSFPEEVVAKIILGEVRSRNDPIFINLVSRQLSTCRSEDRSVSLLAMRVEPEVEQDRPRLSACGGNGLVLWQQKLVNWLADQPEVQEPYAFTSAGGELILCLLDIERNTATGLLRQGLVETLTGKRLADEEFVSLARVQIPARYHAGIASVSSPGASFDAQQLIAATYRCLEAAQRHGKAAIKSIEVY